MKKNNVIRWMFLLVAVFMLTLPVQALAGKVYKLGLSLAITGPTSDAGNPYAKGVEDYFNFVNDTKILGDDKIECTIRDDQYNNDITKRNFEDFISQGIVFYLNYSTGSTLALKKDFEEEKMPVLPASFHAGNLIDSHYIFLPIASYSAQAIGLAEYIVKNHKGGTPKVAMFIHPSAFGRGPVEDLQKAVAAGLKMEIVEVVEHGKDLDNTAMLQRLHQQGRAVCYQPDRPVPGCDHVKGCQRSWACGKILWRSRERSPSWAAITRAATIWLPLPDLQLKISTGPPPTSSRMNRARAQLHSLSWQKNTIVTKRPPIPITTQTA